METCKRRIRIRERESARKEAAREQKSIKKRAKKSSFKKKRKKTVLLKKSFVAMGAYLLELVSKRYEILDFSRSRLYLLRKILYDRVVCNPASVASLFHFSSPHSCLLQSNAKCKTSIQKFEIFGFLFG